MRKLLMTLLGLSIYTIALAQSTPPPPQQEQRANQYRKQLNQSRTVLKVKNNTKWNIQYAIVVYDFEEQSWTSRGWYSVKKYKTSNFPLGDYEGAVYIYGTSTPLGTYKWSGKWKFCVDKNNAFDIINSDQSSCGKTAGFHKRAVYPNRSNRFTFNPG